jgi:putative hemolysin
MLIEPEDVIKAANLHYRHGQILARLIMSGLKLNSINELYANNQHLKGIVFLNKIIELLQLRYEFNHQWQHRIPKEGSFILIANHPLGALEGTILLRNLIPLRPDVKILGNYVMTRIEPISRYVLPVNPLKDKSSQSSLNGLRNALKHLDEGGGLIIFPAGQVSTWQKGSRTITDREWSKNIIRLTKKAHVPVIPAYIDGFNSKLFYWLSSIHPILRTIWIPREFLNKKNRLIRFHIGHPIEISEQDFYQDIISYGKYLRERTYILGSFINNPFPKFENYG